MKELDLSLARFGNERYEIARRNQKARAYCAKKRKPKRNFKMVIFTLALTVCSVIKIANSEYTYAMPTETGYIYVTEKQCEVTEVNGDLITVDYKGELYSFDGNGFSVGEDILCKFTDNMEIVGVVK